MKKIACAVLCLSVSACQPDRSSSDDYLKRLENVLETTGQASDIAVSKFPAPRDLKINFEPSELSIREFLSLRECKLHNTIAQRNSLIGKVARPSQLLFNDIRILEQGPDCLNILENATLSKKLNTFLDKKRNEITRSLWYGLLAQNEHTKFWSLSDTQLNTGVTTSLDALSLFVTNVQTGRFDFNDQQFNDIEQHLGKLRFANGGLLLKRYAQLINTMNRANSAVQQSLAKPLCLSGKPTTKAHYLKTVVNKYFIAKVQREAIELNALSAKLMSSHHKLEQQLLAKANRAYKEWVQQRNKLLKLGKTATTTHAKLLQRLYEQCGIEVGTQP